MPENFRLIISKIFVEELVRHMNLAEEMALKLIDSDDARDDVLNDYLPLLQTKAKVAWQEHCPIGELLGPDKESQYLEYKSTLRTSTDAGNVAYKPLEGAVLKTIAAFTNSRYGGRRQHHGRGKPALPAFDLAHGATGQRLTQV
jgi:hypothetical protein